jgi:hypothetical protein
MTINTDLSKRVYTGNGAKLDYDYDFKIPLASDLKVSLYDLDGVEYVQILDTDYEITGAGSDVGGQVLFTVAPTNGWTIILLSNAGYTQPTDFKNQGRFFPETHENSFDRAVILARQLNERMGRAITVPLGSTGVSGELASISPLQSVRLNAAGTAMEAFDVTPYGTVGGASLIGYQQSGTGATLRTVQDKLREIISVKDYGATGDGVTDDTLAFQRAIAYLEVNSDTRGGTINVPRGVYKVNATLAFTAYAVGLVHNIALVGEGILNTAIDFSGAPAGSDGVTFNKGAQFELRDLAIVNAPRDGVSVNVGATTGSADYCSIFNITRVRVQACGRDGIRCVNAYLGTVEECWSKDNAANGFSFGGFHTSMRVSRCEASGNAAIGYAVNGFTYSAFDNCGSDENDLQGWAISNVQGLTLSGCGSESNGRDGFFVFTSTASATGLNAQSWDIHGLVLESCYGLANSKASPGTYATFLGVTTANSRPAEILIKGGSAHPDTVSDKALILSGTSGGIVLTKELFYDSAFTAADTVSGTTEVKNMTVTGRRCLTLATGAQSIPDAGVDTTINVLNTTPSVNDLGATVSATTITIPRGVNKVRVTANMGWENDGSTGQRTAKIFKNGASFAGTAQDQRAAQTFTLQNIVSAPVSVVAGDTFSLVVSQTSGAARNTLGVSNSFYLCVEAIN